jgi:hypothetical protein
MRQPRLASHGSVYKYAFSGGLSRPSGAVGILIEESAHGVKSYAE